MPSYKIKLLHIARAVSALNALNNPPTEILTTVTEEEESKIFAHVKDLAETEIAKLEIYYGVLPRDSYNDLCQVILGSRDLPTEEES